MLVTIEIKYSKTNPIWYKCDDFWRYYIWLKGNISEYSPMLNNIDFKRYGKRNGIVSTFFNIFSELRSSST